MSVWCELRCVALRGVLLVLFPLGYWLDIWSSCMYVGVVDVMVEYGNSIWLNLVVGSLNGVRPNFEGTATACWME